MMDKQKSISVIVPTYNHGQFLNEAVKSVENQTYNGDIEIIIVDDASTDVLTEPLLKEFHARGHKVIQMHENGGKWRALNAGIEQAKGKLIAIQDADDACHPERLHRQVETLSRFGSYHNLCLFNRMVNSDQIEGFNQAKFDDVYESNVITHSTVTKRIAQGRRLAGVNHFHLAPIGGFTTNELFNEYTYMCEPHGASTIFYKQHWEHGLKFTPGNMGLRIQVAEDSDHNSKLVLLLQRTSILCENLYWYRQGTGTNPAWKEAK